MKSTVALERAMCTRLREGTMTALGTNGTCSASVGRGMLLLGLINSEERRLETQCQLRKSAAVAKLATFNNRQGSCHLQAKPQVRQGSQITCCPSSEGCRINDSKRWQTRQAFQIKQDEAPKKIRGECKLLGGYFSDAWCV